MSSRESDLYDLIHNFDWYNFDREEYKKIYNKVYYQNNRESILRYRKRCYRWLCETYPFFDKRCYERQLELHPDYNKQRYKRQIELHGREEINRKARERYHTVIHES